MISGFCHGVIEIFTLLGCSTDVSVQPIGPIIKGHVYLALEKMGLVGCPETSAINYQSTLHNIPEK
jgi:hypothetical protein